MFTKKEKKDLEVPPIGYKLIGIHQQTGEVKVIGQYALLGSAQTALSELLNARNHFMTKVQDYHLSLQPQSAKELGITSAAEYGKYQTAIVKEINEKMKAFVEANTPPDEYHEYTLHIV